MMSGRRFQAAHTDSDHAQGIDVRGVAVGTHAGIREGYAVARLDHRRHFLQVDLVHDAVAWRDHVDVLERLLGPVDEVKTVFVATVFDGTVLLECLRIETTALDGQRVVDDQLNRHHRIDLGRVTTLIGDGITQASQIDQRGLTEDVVANHAGWEPGKVEVALALDQLAQGSLQSGRITATHEVFRQYARGVRQLGVGTGRDGVHRLAGIEIVQRSARQRLTKLAVHGRSLSDTKVRSSGPT
jgi:hypothetical protein